MASRSALAVSNGGVVTVAATDTIVGTVGYGAAQSLTAAQQAQARANIGATVALNLVDNPTSPYAASAFDDVWCSTASSSPTVTLPASPAVNTRIGVTRSGQYNLIVAANGNTIAGTAADFVIDRDKAGFWFDWDVTASTWQVDLRTRA